MADVFISYSRENEEAVRGLAEAVAGEGYSVWWDSALPPHLSYSDVITSEIGKAKAVIVVWSRQAIASEWVRAEADLARNQKKLVQASLDGRMPPMPFNQLHFVSIGDWRGEPGHPGWLRVKESLASLCRGEVARPAYAFPAVAPPRSATASPSRMWLLIGGIVSLGAAGAAALWMQFAPGATQPKAPNAAETSRPTPAPGVAPAPRRAVPAPAPVSRGAPRTTPLSQPKTQPMTMRRYCTGPGRGTAQCRQWRLRTSRTR